MKKVLLSLVAFLMIFNTISAEEVEVLENDKEVTESILAINAEENTANENTTNENEESNQEDDYKWAAIQPGRTKTSEGLIVDYSYEGYFRSATGSYYLFTLVYTIPEDYEE